MYMKKVLMCFIMSLVSSTSFAGLDRHGRSDEVIAVYKFENVQDSGPRSFHGVLRDGASIVSTGKIGKCLYLWNNQSFTSLDDLSLGGIGNFSIVGWIKTRSIAADKSIILGAASEEDDEGFSAISINISSDLYGSDTIIGFIADGENDGVDAVIAEDVDVTDGEWNHVAFTLTENFYRIFINGEVAKEKKNAGSTGFVGNHDTRILVTSTSAGNHYIDEVVFFETGFSPYEIKGLYNDGLSRFMRIMPVNPEGLVTTTWADIKAGRK